jgi:drug/metabolite transporter (DMT)-like permease
MKKKMSTVKIIGIVLLVIGVIVLVWGAYNLISFSSSTGGKILNKTAGFFGGQTETVRNAIIMMVIGAVAAVAGFLVYKKR